MARKCKISGKAGQYGNRVSHAKNRKKHKFLPNLQEKKIYSSELGRQVKIKVSTRMQRTIDKIGLSKACKKYGVSLKELASN
ncbi:MAG: 50S ribosomal protein L28 [Bdellovibrionales bacterium]|nr:50S ribosomal protein L28 [Bdellovibrionales bacterium]